jgi:hypothetical protein
MINDSVRSFLKYVEWENGVTNGENAHINFCCMVDKFWLMLAKRMKFMDFIDCDPIARTDRFLISCFHEDRA